MNRFDVFPSKFLSAADIDEEGNTYVIRSVYMEKMRDGAEKPILVLDGAPKDMVLNVTNWNVIARLHGDESDDWEGKPITIYPTETQMNGDMVPCIRVKARQPKPKSPSKRPEAKGSPEAEKAIKAAAEVPGNGGGDVPF